MDKTALLETLVMSEKNHSIVEIKMINTDRLVTGAVQKVLNQIIILRSPASQPVTLTFADIESVRRLSHTVVDNAVSRVQRRVHQLLRRK